MKKKLLNYSRCLLSGTVLILSPSIFADTFWGIYLGGGLWQSQYEGNIGDPSINLKELGFDKSNNRYYYLAIEHPVPLLPNLRLQRTDISSTHTALISQSFTLNDITFEADTDVTMDLDISHTDFTFYYEILDNWANLDIGLTLRHFDGHAMANNEFHNESVKLDELLPLAYARAEFELPFTGFSLGMSGQGISYSDNRLTDIDVYLRYTLDLTLDFAVDVGYRSMDLRLDEKDIQTRAKFSGPYLGLLVHF